MSAAAEKLLSEFEALPVEQQQEFVREVMNHLPPWDCGPLNDDAVAVAGDALAAMLHEEERASSGAAKSSCSTAGWLRRFGLPSFSAFLSPIQLVPCARFSFTRRRFADRS